MHSLPIIYRLGKTLAAQSWRSKLSRERFSALALAGPCPGHGLTSAVRIGKRTSEAPAEAKGPPSPQRAAGGPLSGEADKKCSWQVLRLMTPKPTQPGSKIYPESAGSPPNVCCRDR